MNSSVFSASTPADFFSINNGIYLSGHDGDISIGSGNGYKSYFAWGTTGQSAHVINATGALGFSTNLGTTPALSGTTGFGTTGQALVTAGSAAAPAWGTVGVNGGGTGVATLSGLAYGNGTSAFTAATAAQVVSVINTTAVTNATNATNTAITDDTTTSSAVYPTWVTTTTGNLPQKTASTKFSFIPSTGYLTVTGLTSPVINNPTVTNYVESVVSIGTVTSSNTIALTNGTVQTATLTASTACTFTMPTATAGKSFVLLLKQAASTGNGTATFTSVKWGTSGAPTITATAGKMDILTFVADGTNWYGSAAQGYTP